MYVRLAFSVAAHLEPEILLVDEVLAVGDAEFQRRCLGRMEELGESGRTVLFVSHNMQAIAQLCDRAILLEKGLVVEDGPAPSVVAHYLQSGHGTGASRELGRRTTPRATTSSGFARARVVQDGEEASTQSMFGSPVGIEIGFDVLRDGGPPIFPKIKLVDQRGDVAFNAMDTSARWLEPTPPGEYVSTAWIPGNLLNEGLIDVRGRDRVPRSAEASAAHRRQTSPSTFRTSAREIARRASSRVNGRALSGRCSTGRPRRSSGLPLGDGKPCGRVELVERAREHVAALGQRRERRRRGVRHRREHARLVRWRSRRGGTRDVLQKISVPFGAMNVWTPSAGIRFSSSPSGG